jgi:tetratricopeptide (TPR) repeat protein
VTPAGQRPFIGRGETVAAFHARREQLRQGHGAITVLQGDSGVGKTVLLDGFLEESHRLGHRVLRARARRGTAPPPFQLVREALGVKAQLPNGSAGPEAGAVGSEARLSEMLRSLGDMSEPVRARSLAPLAEPFLALAREGPTILALEDFAYADGPSLDFVLYLQPFLPEQRLWIILTGPASAELPEEARKFMEALPRSPHVDRWQLRALAPSEVVEFIRWADPARSPGPSELTTLFTQTGGNPLFLEQVLLAHRRSTPSIWEEARSAGVPLPEFVRARLNALPEEERRTVSLAAVIGLEFPFPLLFSASGMEEELLAEVVERLIERGLLREGANDLLEFARDDLREIAYQDLTDPLRRLLHQRVAQALEATGRTDPDALFALAHHTYFGKLDELAAQYNRRAAEFAARVVSPEIARTHLERALESLRRAHPEDRAGELEIVLELALTLDRLGELGRAESTLREALAREVPASAASGAAAQLLPVYLARILTDEGRWAEARTLTDQLLDHLADFHAPAARLALLRLRGEIEYYRGEYRDALRYHDLALDIARAQGDLREVALSTVRRANALAMIPDCLGEAIPTYREAAEQLLRLGDRAEAGFALLFLGVTLSQNGRASEGLEELEGAAALAEQSADLRQLGWALFNIADVRSGSGEFEIARQRNARSREILSRIGDRFGLAQTHIIAGKIAIAANDFSTAELELLEGFRLVRELRTEPDELEVLLRLAEVALGQGNPGLARERVVELERREIARLRPDLVSDLHRLAARLRVAGELHDAPVPA